MVRKSYFVLSLNCVNFVSKHLLICVQPESEHQRDYGTGLHYSDVLNSKFFTESGGNSIEVGQSQTLHCVLDSETP